MDLIELQIEFNQKRIELFEQYNSGIEIFISDFKSKNIAYEELINIYSKKLNDLEPWNYDGNNYLDKFKKRLLVEFEELECKYKNPIEFFFSVKYPEIKEYAENYVNVLYNGRSDRPDFDIEFYKNITYRDITLFLAEKYAIVDFINYIYENLNSNTNDLFSNVTNKKNTQNKYDKTIKLINIWDTTKIPKIKEELDLLEKAKFIVKTNSNKKVWNRKEYKKLLAITEIWKEKNYIRKEYKGFKNQKFICTAVCNEFGIENIESVYKNNFTLSMISGDEINLKEDIVILKSNLAITFSLLN